MNLVSQILAIKFHITGTVGPYLRPNFETKQNNISIVIFEITNGSNLNRQIGLSYISHKSQVTDTFWMFKIFQISKCRTITEKHTAVFSSFTLYNIYIKSFELPLTSRAIVHPIYRSYRYEQYKCTLNGACTRSVTTCQTIATRQINHQIVKYYKKNYQGVRSWKSS